MPTMRPDPTFYPSAKQAAEVDLLTGGRFRFGVGVGWNPVEYEALGMRFEDRGKMLDEQIELLRKLWRGGMVEHHGRFFDFPKLSMSPAADGEIPIVVGGVGSSLADSSGKYLAFLALYDAIFVLVAWAAFEYVVTE